MSLFKNFKADLEIARLEYPANDDGKIPTILVRRFSKSANPKYRKALDKFSKPHRRDIAADRISDSKMQTIMNNAFIEGCVVGWENVVNQDDEPIVFSMKAAKDMFEQLPDLLEDLQQRASQINTFQKQDLEDDLKN